MPPRSYERVRCPVCGRMVAAHVPYGGDDRGRLQVSTHHWQRRGSPSCPASDRRIVHGLGGWKVDA